MSDTFHYNKLEGILYGGYVRHNRLSKLVYETYSNTSIANATELNIFIDLYSIMHAIFSENDRTDITDYSAITSCIINMCGHYRSFFSKIGVHTKIFLIFSFNICDINRKFVAGYNEIFYKKVTEIEKFKEVAYNNFNLLEVLCPYLPDIFFVHSKKNYESSVVISNIIDILGNNTPNLIITKDLYPIQLCTLHPYTSLLRPRKTREEDISTMITITERPDYRESFWSAVAEKREIGLDKLMRVSPLNFSLLMALYKFPERNIGKTTNIINAIKIIETVIGNEDIKVLPSQLYEYQDIVNNIPLAKVESIYNALDVSFMKNYYRLDPESKDIKFVNSRDDGVLNHINSKFFANNPIDFSKL